MSNKEEFLRIAEEITPRLVEIRRDIHRHPEIGLKEERTSELVAKTLEEMGIEVQRNVYATGVVGLIRGKKPGKTILIRADMDALPVTEETGCPFASENPGMMHACGHDAHTTWLLGAAMILSRMKDDLCGNVKLMFQPAEECPGGAAEMIEAGVLKNPTVDYAMGAHISPECPTGVYLMEPGPVTSNPDFFTLTLYGKDSHGAYPHKSIDALNMGVQVYNLLQSFVSRLSDACDEVVLSVCMMNAGTSRGQVPGKCELQGTVRSFRPEIREQAKAFIENAAKSVTELYGGRYEFDYIALSFPIMNDAKLTEDVQNYTAELYGSQAVLKKAKKFMGGEDYCFIARAVPSVFTFVGTAGDKYPVYPLHNPKFMLDEDVLPKTSAFLAYNAYRILEDNQ